MPTQVCIAHSCLACCFNCSPDITESTAVPQPSKTSSPSPSSTAVPTSSTSSAVVQPTVESDTSGSPPLNQTRSNAIGGGVVGGFFALLLLVSALSFWICRRRRIPKQNGEVLNSPVMSAYRTDTLPSQPTIPVPSIVSCFFFVVLVLILLSDRLVAKFATTIGINLFLCVMVVLRLHVPHSVIYNPFVTTHSLHLFPLSGLIGINNATMQCTYRLYSIWRHKKLSSLVKKFDKAF